jgi:hypothetical protein
MITSMEEFWKRSWIDFSSGKYYAEDKFGKNGFKAIEEERTQILRKEFKRAQLKWLRSILNSKIILAILLALAFKVFILMNQ